MLHAKNVPPQLWAECLKVVVYATNRLPQVKLRFISLSKKFEISIPEQAISKHLGVYAMFSYLTTYVVNVKKR